MFTCPKLSVVHEVFLDKTSTHFRTVLTLKCLIYSLPTCLIKWKCRRWARVIVASFYYKNMYN